MLDRREFLKIAAATTGAILINPSKILSTSLKRSFTYFAVHPFIEQNPDAVFIMRTNVDVKTNAEAKLQAGLNLGKSVFVPSTEGEGGFSISNNVVIKPNLTDRRIGSTPEEKERLMGIVTDVYFVEGIIESLKTLGIAGDQFFMREVNGPKLFADAGYIDMAQRTGADIRDLSAKVGSLDPNDVVWKDIENGVWFRKIPYLWPINAADAFFLNVAKLKAHGMGLTLCAKNLQGSIAHYYQQHCNGYYTPMSIDYAHVNPTWDKDIKNNFEQHRNIIPRWNSEGSDHNCGLGQETWVSRCLDNNSVSKPNLHIIEGVYGRDGDFARGPNNGYAEDYMVNFIIFGKNPFHVDNIGHWLGGHEPGNFGLLHIAIERGLSSILNPKDIPVYEWKADGSATLTSLENFERTPLKTYYLHQEGKEDYWHLCNEPFDYPATGVALNRKIDKPKSFILNQNYPNPFNPSTAIEFVLPERGNARLEIFNSRGETVQVLLDDVFDKGAHLAVWNTRNVPSGTYFYRLQFNSFSEIKKMTLVR